MSDIKSTDVKGKIHFEDRKLQKNTHELNILIATETTDKKSYDKKSKTNA